MTNTILSHITQLSAQLTARTNQTLGVQQCLSSLATSQQRIEKHQQTPTLEARALYQTLRSIALFEKVIFTPEEERLLQAIQAFAHQEGAKGEFQTLAQTNAWRRPF